jgi:hypothetical protein
MNKTLLASISIAGSLLVMTPSFAKAMELQDAEAELRIAQKDLEDSKAYGAPVQAQAKKRLREIEKEYKQLVKKAEKENLQKSVE